MTIAIVFGCCMFVSIIWLHRAWRSRPLDDRPFCRKCRYDLSGRDGKAAVCPECGANLARRKALGIGIRRQRSWVSIAMAAMVLLGSGFGLVATCIPKARAIRWIEYQPLWMLKRNAFNEMAGDGAIQELCRRIRRGSIDEPAMDELIEQAIATNSDGGKSFSRKQHRVFLAADGSGALDEVQRQRYLKGFIESHVELEVREFVRCGQQLPIGLDVPNLRTGQRTFVPFLKVRKISIGDSVVEPANFVWPPTDHSNTKAFGHGGTTLETGQRQVEIEIEVELYETRHDAWRRANHLKLMPGSQPRAVWTSTFQRIVNFVSADSSTIQTVSDPGIADAIRSQNDPDKLRVALSGELCRLEGTISAWRVGADAAFDVLIRTQTGEHLIAQAAMSETSCGWVYYNHLRTKADFGAPVKTVDLIFRSNPALGESMPDHQRIWDGEIVFHDWPVSWIDGPTH